MGAPAALVAGRFAWVGYKDRIPFMGRRRDRTIAATDQDATDPVTSPVDRDANADIEAVEAAAPAQERAFEHTR
jgi:hypothetical protein